MTDYRFLISNAAAFVKKIEDAGLQIHGRVSWRDHTTITAENRYVVFRELPEEYPGQRFTIMTWVLKGSDITAYENATYDNREAALVGKRRAIGADEVVGHVDYTIRCWIYLMGASRIVVYKSSRGIDLCMVRNSTDEVLKFVKGLGVQALVREPELVVLAQARP